MHFQPIENTSRDAYLAHQGGGGGLRVEHQTSHDQLDDVFGSSPTEQEVQNGLHPSDMRRLETEHTTAGYREGISTAKESSIQAGFDEGFSLGAVIGLQTGQLLGFVEGIANALKGHTTAAAEASMKLLTQARQDLSTDKIFSPDYWQSDGNWRYEVPTDEGKQTLFSDVANAHPLILKWKSIVDGQVVVWEVERSLLDNETVPCLDTTTAEALNCSAPTRAKQSLDW